MAGLKSRIADKDLLFGFCITYPAPGILENVAKHWDWIWIDCQHGEIDHATMIECIRACDLVGTPSIVRVPKLDYVAIGVALDAGATGVMVPMIETADQAREAVRGAYFPPLGGRSFAGRRANDIHGRSEYLDWSAKETVVMLQIETVTGVENSEAIAGVDGVDVLFVGPTDLRLTMGLSIDTPLDEPKLAANIKRTISAASVAGLATATVATARPSFDWCLQAGMTMIAVAVDETALRTDSEERQRWLAEVKKT